ncbi:MAG: hypothetical protein OXJ52_08990 [Oligoflexia bacterium]|nr:hypothetical protein [Oligoflexia bacterium]
MEQIQDKPPDLWLKGCSNSKAENDCIPVDEASKLKTSLCLIYVPSIKVHVYTGIYKGKRKARAKFDYNNTKYNLSITDPKAESHFFKKQDEEYPMNNLYLCVSIGEPFNGCCYKLVAGIITKKGNYIHD